MKNTKIPNNIEELIEYGWTDYMRKRIKQYGLVDINHQPEDVLQDMLVQMISTNFLESYNPEGRPFEVYISVFVSNFMSKLYKREYHSRNGQSILRAKTIEFTAPENEADWDAKGTLYLDNETSLQQEDSYSFMILVDSIREELKQFKAHSSNVYEGKEYQRDPATVFELLLNDYTVAEIAEMFGTSKNFIYTCMRKIRGIDLLKDYSLNR